MWKPYNKARALGGCGSFFAVRLMRIPAGKLKSQFLLGLKRLY